MSHFEAVYIVGFACLAGIAIAKLCLIVGVAWSNLTAEKISD